MDSSSRQQEAVNIAREHSEVPLAVRRFERGRRVRICAGELIGLEGTVVELAPPGRCLVDVAFHNDSLRVELAVDSLVALDESAP